MLIKRFICCRNLTHSSHTLCTLRYARYARYGCQGCAPEWPFAVCLLAQAGTGKTQAPMEAIFHWQVSIFAAIPNTLRYACMDVPEWPFAGRLRWQRTAKSIGCTSQPPFIIKSSFFAAISHFHAGLHSCKEHIVTTCCPREPNIEVMALQVLAI